MTRRSPARLMGRSCRIVIALSCASAAFAAGCGGSGNNASKPPGGAPVTSGPQTLDLESPDPEDPEITYLASQIRKRANGALFVSTQEDYATNKPKDEVALARAIRSGERDFAIVATRAWPAAGVPAFAALQAPFVIGTARAAGAALAGPAGDALNAAVRDAGVVPLALIPAELRRVLANRALTTHSSYRGAHLRIYDNPVSADVIRSLGARPHEGLTAEDVVPGLQAGRLDGAETAPIYAVDNDYATAAKHMTGYALFDKVYAFVASEKAWKRFSKANQAAVRAAAADTVRFAATLAARDDADLARLCEQGVRVDVPTPAAMRGLAEAERPVLAALARDADAGPVLRMLQASPGTGPRVLVPPKECAP